MKLDEYLTDHKAADLAVAIETSESFVSQWRRGERPVPIRFCLAIEQATGGLVTRRDLRPDDWHLIWPELVKDAA